MPQKSAVHHFAQCLCCYSLRQPKETAKRLHRHSTERESASKRQRCLSYLHDTIEKRAHPHPKHFIFCNHAPTMQPKKQRPHCASSMQDLASTPCILHWSLLLSSCIALLPQSSSSQLSCSLVLPCLALLLLPSFASADLDSSAVKEDAERQGL